jgi:hypothetical protein
METPAGKVKKITESPVVEVFWGYLWKFIKQIRIWHLLDGDSCGDLVGNMMLKRVSFSGNSED